MATLIYLESDDEITSAASRIRAAEAGPVAIVVPFGSRLATSRINFRLLAREAQTRGRQLSIVAADGATRSLAASAGLPVFGSVGEYEAAVEAGPPDGGEGPSVAGLAGSAAAGAAGAAGAARAVDVEAAGEPDGGNPTNASMAGGPAAAAAASGRPFPADPDSPTIRWSGATGAGLAAGAGLAGGAAGDPGATRDPDAPGTGVPPPRTARPAEPARRLPVGRIAIVVAVVAVLLAGAAGVGAFLYLPSATVVVTPRVENLGPVRLTVVADPDTSVTDPASATIPAQRLTFEVIVTDTFPATGRRIEEAPATGEVTFASLNTGGSNQVPIGSIVATEGGIQFRTTAPVNLPAARVIPGEPPRIEPSNRTVGVEAVRPGPEGNVPPNAITVVPSGENPSLTQVRNPAALTGGRRQEFSVVSQADVDGAVAALDEALSSEFEAILANPASVPAGTTLFPETAALGEPVGEPDPATLVGQEIADFDLTERATGTVVAVDESAVAELAELELRDQVETDHRLVAGSIEVQTGRPTVDGERVRFPATATGRQVRQLEATELRAAITGRPIDEARAILEAFGEVEISVWPDWVTSIPTLDDRLELTVNTPVDVEPDPSDDPPATPVSPTAAIDGASRPAGATAAAIDGALAAALRTRGPAGRRRATLRPKRRDRPSMAPGRPA